MATQNLAGIDALLKNVYRGPLVEQFNNETVMLNIIKPTNANDIGNVDSFGRQIIFPVHSSRNRGRGGGTDGGQLPVAGTQGTQDGTVVIRYFAGGIEITDQAIRQSKTNEAAFERGLTMEMDNCRSDLQKDVNRIVYGTGDGLLASCTATQAGINTFSVDSGQYIAVGDTVDVATRATGALKTSAGGQVVTAVAYTGSANSASQANANITVGGGTISVTAADGVYLTGDRNQESDGLRNICNTGRILHGINSSTNAYWDSNIKDFLQANPNEDGIMALVQQVRQRSNSAKPDLVMLTLGGQRRLANTYGSQKRWNDAKATDVTGGFESIMVSAGGAPTPVMADPDCPNGKGFALNKGSFAFAELTPPDWLEPPDGNGTMFTLKDGASLGTRARTWQAWMVWDASVVCVAPNRNGQLVNINDDIPVQRL